MYIVKFLYQWLLPPAGLFLLLVVLNMYMYYRRAAGRKVLSLILAVFYLLSIRIGADMLARPLENWYPQPALSEVSGDVLLMLGNGSNGAVPDMDGIGQPSGTMGKSMLFAARLQRATNLPILTSGGMVFADTGTETDIALREFRALGIPQNKLFGENRSRNTVENARFSKVICDEQGFTRPILLVVALQAPRSAMIFEREGLNCQVYPTHYRRGVEWHFNPILDLIPSAGNMDDSAAALKEYLGILALKVRLQ